MINDLIISYSKGIVLQRIPLSFSFSLSFFHIVTAFELIMTYRDDIRARLCAGRFRGKFLHGARLKLMTPRGVKKAFFFPVAKGNKGFAFTLPRPPPATGKSTVIARLHFNVLGTRPKMYLKDSYYAARYSLMDNLSTFTIFNIFESFEIGFFRDKKRRDILLVSVRIFEKEGSKERIVRFRNPISNSELTQLFIAIYIWENF